MKTQALGTVSRPARSDTTNLPSIISHGAPTPISALPSLALALGSYLDSTPSPGLTSYCPSFRTQPKNLSLKDSSLNFPSPRQVPRDASSQQHTLLLLLTYPGNIPDGVLTQTISCALVLGLQPPRAGHHSINTLCCWFLEVTRCVFYQPLSGIWDST